jgi:hypothetical protein
MFIRKVLLLLVTLLLFSIQTLYGKDKDIQIEIPSVSSSLLTEKPITIGDPIDVALIVYHNKKDEAVYPTDADIFQPFKLKDMVKTQKRIKQKSFRTMIIYSFTIYQTGKFTLPPFEVRIGEKVLKTGTMDIAVLSVLPRDQANPTLKDVVPPYRARIRPLMVAIMVLSVLTAATAVYVVQKLLRRLKKPEPEVITAVETIDPYEYSLKELRELKKAHEGNTAETKQVYSKLSFVLRFFIGNLLKMNAPQMTTREIGRHMKKKQFYSVPSPQVMNLLNKSDMVKFAKEKPSKQKVGTDIEDSIDIIEKAHATDLKANGSESQLTRTGTPTGSQT